MEFRRVLFRSDAAAPKSRCLSLEEASLGEGRLTGCLLYTSADGISKGKILAKKEDTIALSKLGLPVEQIASALQIDIEIARQWIRDE